MRRPMSRNNLLKLSAAWGAGLALALSVSAATAAAPPKSAPRRAVARRAPAPAPALPLYQKSRFREPTPEERLQFHAELKEQGWPVVMYAPVPTAYGVEKGRVIPVQTRFATLYGDLDGDRQPEWVVGCYFHPLTVPEPREVGMQTGMEQRARIVVFKKDAEGRWRFRWRSPGLGYEFRVPLFNLQEVEHGLDLKENLRLPLSLVDVDRDGKLDIAYHAWSEAAGGGGLPGVYRCEGGRFLSVAPQADRFSLLDLNRDGKLEVITGSPYVGYGAGDDDVPRVWRWNGRRYQEASVDFPGYYVNLLDRYRKFVRQREKQGLSYPRTVWERAIQKASNLSGQAPLPTTLGSSDPF